VPSTQNHAAPPSTRVLIIIGAVMFIGLGLGGAALAWTGGEPRLQLETVPAAMALGGLLALPGLVAGIALRRNDPRLLWPAIVTGLLPVALTLLSVGLVFVIPVLLFVQAALRWPMPQSGRSWRRALVTLAIPALAVVAGLAFFAHQDPACWDYSENPQGRITYTRAELHSGMQSGWFVGGGTVTGLSVNSDAGESNGSVCVSDRITPLEAAIALGLIAGAGWIALGTSRPRETLRGESPLADGS